MIKKRIFVTIIFIIFSSNVLSQQKSVVPDWFLRPRKPKGEYFYAVGISELNGSVEEKKEVSLNRAILNLSILYRCKISSMLRNYLIADTNFTTDVIKITVENIPKTDDITVTRRWKKRDGHLYTEIKAPILNSRNTSNSAMVKYYFEEESSSLHSSEIYEYFLFLSNNAKIDIYRINESYTDKNGILDFENIFIEHNSDFKKWFGKSLVPEWYLNLPVSEDNFISLGHSIAPNLYLANELAFIKALSDLSIKVQTKIQSMLREFEKEVGDSSGVKSDAIDFCMALLNGTVLGCVRIAERNVGIDKNGNFEVFVQIEMPVNTIISETLKESRNYLHRDSSDD